MAIANRLAIIEQEIRQVENEKLQREQTLGAFWQHMLAIDPIIIRDRMLFRQEREEILVEVAILRDLPTGDGEIGRIVAF